MSQSSSKYPGCSGCCGLLLFICYIIWIFPISITDTITCQRLKQGYVICQLKHTTLPVFWSNSITKFQLLGTEVETPYNSEGCQISTLYLKTDKERIKFYYNCNTSQIYIDAKKLDTFLDDNGRSYLQINRDQKPFFEGIINLIVSITLLWFLSIPVFVWNWFIKNINERRIIVRRSLKINKNSEHYKKVKKANEELNKRIEET
ncbi:hypothetical protein LC653_16195 [Nostoc sp. CHAB 5784]|uniref:hypothetical protein n=1 Tax=Nostoc mirabile TaxID=2907820 RepID=UPI001E28D9CB|nr:hypothetical protein [Nostoc mirabile]MCC5665416.1 hypothetical protein [Nostoc mirabile CHAB5784]